MRVLEKKDDGSVGASPTRAEAPLTSGEAWLHCVACGHPSTPSASRLSVAGSIVHVFMNPGGFVFEIECFSKAPGARAAGSPSTEWSWFPGHAWTTELCAGCASHVGWRFDASSGGGTFHGLVRDRIAEGA